MITTEQPLASPTDIEIDDDVEHGFCSDCFKAGLRMGLCGTPMPPDPNIIPADDAGSGRNCFVCYSPGIRCNSCGRTF